jgi:hypothetical protein
MGRFRFPGTPSDLPCGLFCIVVCASNEFLPQKRVQFALAFMRKRCPAYIPLKRLLLLLRCD